MKLCKELEIFLCISVDVSSLTSFTENATKLPLVSFLFKVSHENETVVALIFVAVMLVGGTDGAKLKQNTKVNLYGTMISKKM